MDLKKFEFPEATTADIAFPTFETIPELLEEAKRRKFYNGTTEFNKLFSRLFYLGGKVRFKEGLDEDFKKNAWMYLRVFMGSYAPKHEEKEAICAMLLSELVEQNLSTI